MKASRNHQTAFTLLELLVVVAVIGILASILLPVLARARAKSQSMFCLNNTRQLGIACLIYSTEHDDRLPYNLGGAGFRGIVHSTNSLNWVDGIMSWELDADN